MSVDLRKEGSFHCENLSYKTNHTVQLGPVGKRNRRDHRTFHAPSPGTDNVFIKN